VDIPVIPVLYRELSSESLGTWPAPPARLFRSALLAFLLPTAPEKGEWWVEPPPEPGKLAPTYEKLFQTVVIIMVTQM